MGCEKCTTTPEKPYDVKKIVIFANHDYMLKKFFDHFSKTFQMNYQNDYIETLIDFDEFVTIISKSKIFTQVELENILAIVLEKDESPTFKTYKKAKTFSYWINLYYADDLKWILDNESIVTFFQPILDVPSGEIYAYECLSRGKKKDGTLMPPDVMFESARKTEMLFNLDRQCRISALKNAKSRGITKKIFINFTPTSIYNPEFCLRDTVKTAIDLDFDLASIVFEVVESERVENITHLKNIFDFYKNMGFKVALDDVGSGYSSLNMLAELKPDIIKIDMKLVRDVDKDPVKKAIISSLVLIAKELNLLTLAEGIETESELNVIRELKIDFAQGYFIGRPSADI